MAYTIGALPGYTNAIGHLVSMLTYVRDTTIAAVNGLSAADLDYVLDDDANSIGALLMHIAGVESAYQVTSFGLHHDLAPWQTALDRGPRARREIRGHDLQHYVDTLTRVRGITLAELGKRDDSWLLREADTVRGQPANHYWYWFHVFEDELNHRGQIRLIVKRLPRRKA